MVILSYQDAPRSTDRNDDALVRHVRPVVLREVGLRIAEVDRVEATLVSPLKIKIEVRKRDRVDAAPALHGMRSAQGVELRPVEHRPVCWSEQGAGDRPARKLGLIRIARLKNAPGSLGKLSGFQSGSDGTRTRDLRRDRPAL